MHRRQIRVLAGKLLVAVLLMAASSHLHALDPAKKIAQYVHDAWRSQEGLPQNSGQAILQTRDGYLWFGTQEGLARFNGQDFTVFNRTNTKAIRYNWVQALLEDRDGSLWIGMEGGGLVHYSHGQFLNYTTSDGLSSNHVTALTQDPDGNLWIGTSQGLNEFKDGKFITQFGTDELSHGNIRRLQQDGKGSVWLLQDQKLKLVRHGRAVTSEIPEELRKLTGVAALYVGKQSDLWLGSSTQGVIQFRDGRLTRYGTAQGLIDPVIDVMYEDRASNLWVGTGRGLCRLQQGRFECYSTKEGLSGERVLSIYEDRESSLWVGTESGGVNRFKDGAVTTYGAPSGLKASIVWSVATGKNGNIWLGTDTGIEQFRDDGIVANPIQSPRSHTNSSCVFEDNEGNVWVSRPIGGVTEFVKDEGYRPIEFSVKNGLVDGMIRAIYQDSKGYLWLGSQGFGVSRFWKGRFTNFNTTNGLAGDNVWFIHEAHEGSIWFGQDGKLTRFQDGKFSSFAIPENADGTASGTPPQIFAIHEDSEHVFWLGTMAAGLKRFKNGKVTTFTTRDGMMDDNVWNILEDDLGYLWMASNRGIFRVKRADLNDYADGIAPTIQGTAYGTADGMLSADCAGATQPTASKTRDGKLLFGCVGGVVVVNPTALAFNRLPPPVKIEQAAINSVIHTGQDARMSVGRGELEFQFAALSYRAPGKIKFKYKLEGFNQDWIAAGNRRVAYYTNIPPGQYRFRVFAANDDGVWNEEGASFSFYLVPHFYQTPWFWCLAALAMFGLVGAIVLLRVRQLRRREEDLKALVHERTEELQLEIKNHQTTEKELQQEVMARMLAGEKAESATRSKSEFLANMSHEIRTPLNGVIGMLELARQTTLTLDQDEILGMANDSAGALLAVINDILDFSKIEAGKLELEAAELDVADTVAEAARTMALRAHQKHLELACHIAPDVPRRIIGDSARLRQVLMNLLGNAIKFTESGEVVVRVSKEPPQGEDIQLKFSVTDTGIGIPAEKQAGIFQAFSQADSSVTRRFGGTGLGLTICSRIVDLMGGRIWVESYPGKGSTFAFTATFKASATSALPSTQASQHELRGLTALIVDDNPTNRLILQQMLESWGMVAVPAETLEQGRDLLQRALAEGRPFRLLLADYHMSGIDGLKLICEMRSHPELACPAIMMLTSEDYSNTAASCREFGIHTLLIKPVKQSDLLAAVLGLLTTGAATPEVTATPANGKPGAVQKLRVLLAEDNMVNQKLAERMLGKLHHRVVIVNNGKEAFERIQQEPFDLVLMDMQMPEMDGLAATQAVREWEKGRGRHIPIIAMTANAMKGDDLICLAAGMDGYIAKPISLIMLKNIIEQVLADSGKTQALAGSDLTGY